MSTSSASGGAFASGGGDTSAGTRWGTARFWVGWVGRGDAGQVHPEEEDRVAPIGAPEGGAQGVDQAIALLLLGAQGGEDARGGGGARVGCQRLFEEIRGARAALAERAEGG